MDPRDYCEWIKLEREKQILCINVYVLNLKKNWHRWSIFTKAELDTDLENKCMDNGAAKGEYELRVLGIVTYICLSEKPDIYITSLK